MQRNNLIATRRALVAATKHLATYKWQRRGDSKAAIRHRVSVLTAWLHCQLWAQGKTALPPKTKAYTLEELYAAMTPMDTDRM